MKLADIKLGDVLMMDDGNPVIQAGEHVVGGQHENGYYWPMIVDGNGHRILLTEDEAGNAVGVLRRVW